ncbi:hypothetical protein [Halorhabdus amylolytica]|uniref:hypothetical protein n=1 Tax=Halorhabdus amylolytica TaxID=2559573 RepID=UPI0010AB08D7|nr:hypothetical protein [Halorhabdus amylolytica]
MTDVLRAFFVASVVLLVFLGLSVPTIEPGSPTFVIAVLSGGMLLTMLVGSAVLIYVDWDPFEEIIENGHS